MAKRLPEIKESINKSGIDFYKYLHMLLKEDIMQKIDELVEVTDVYIFSGIIRNYFLKIYLKRDVDIILGKDIDIYKAFHGLPIKKNSFGGYKISYPSGPLDLWFLKDTWAFKHGQKTMDFGLESSVPNTAFFNFSSIVYSVNKKEFYFSNHFLKFLRDKKLDYVYKQNANYALCIINTIYYSEKFNLKIADRLKKYIVELNQKYENDYDAVQIKHFGQILYNSELINEKLNVIKSSLIVI